jgi:fructose-bisphosphate aldolase, class I
MMERPELEKTAQALVAAGKGILAADETVPTLTKRFDTLKIASTKDSRRTYREMFFTTPGIADCISGVILQDETIRQKNAADTSLAEILSRQGIIPGIKVDTGAKVLAGSPEETVTEGLDGLRDRLKEYAAMGARFAKWRAVIRITDALPSRMCVTVNAHALARYAALCQEQGIVPIVEPEVLMDGSHTIERCEDVTSSVLHTVFQELFEQCVRLEGILLKPNMVIAGKDCSEQASVQEVATATWRCLRRQVPAAVPGIVFLSGGQSSITATVHLDAINRLAGSKPWPISFSFGRALQDMALEAWRGQEAYLKAGQQAFYQRAKCNSEAAMGRYTDKLEHEPVGASQPAYRSNWHDD